MKTLALYNLKGGVGKTAAAVNLAFLAAQNGYRTLLWDLDPQGAASWYLGLAPQSGGSAKQLVKGKRPAGNFVQSSGYARLDVLPAHVSNRHLDLHLRTDKVGEHRLAELLAPFSETYALVVLDCPPSLSHLSEQVLRAADLIALPLIPTPLSVRAYAQVVDVLAKAKLRKVKLYPFLSMVDRRRGLHRTLVQSLPGEIKTLLRSHIPYAAAVEQMGTRRAPLPAFDASSPASRAYAALWAELEGLLAGR